MTVDMNANMKIPVAIITFDNNGLISYRAYSPNNYFSNEDGSNLYNRSEQLAQFLTHVYNRIGYDSIEIMNNVSNYGNIKEIHSRYIRIPITDRHNICYFSTFNHQHCNYKPIHVNSPVFFDENQADNYVNIQSNLFHNQCIHEFV